MIPIVSDEGKKGVKCARIFVCDYYTFYKLAVFSVLLEVFHALTLKIIIDYCRWTAECTAILNANILKDFVDSS